MLNSASQANGAANPLLSPSTPAPAEGSASTTIAPVGSIETVPFGRSGDAASASLAGSGARASAMTIPESPDLLQADPALAKEVAHLAKEVDQLANAVSELAKSFDASGQGKKSGSTHRRSAMSIPGGGPHGAHQAHGHGKLTGTSTKDGQALPHSSGRATCFWNGNYRYKGQRDPGNRGPGAWGDANKPTDYICALPVGLHGGGNWWHNQKILVTNPQTGKQVVVRVQDKGPAPHTGNHIDLSPVAIAALTGQKGDFANASIDNVQIAFAPDNAPVGPVS